MKKKPMKVMKRKLTVLLAALTLVAAVALVSGCGKDPGDDLPIVTATPTVSGGDPSATPTPDRFPNRSNADTGKGTPKELEAGDVAPEFSLTMMDGSTFRMSEHDDEVVLLNFWATWCGPCVNEMPDLMQLASENSPGFTICFISIDDSVSDVKDFLSNKSYNNSIIGYDKGARICNYYPTGGIPYTVIVVNGVVKETVLGSRSYDKYKALVTNALSGK